MRQAFCAREIFTGEEIQTGKAILVDNGQVEKMIDRDQLPPGYVVRDLGAYLLAPAFIDLQIYGGNGHLFSDELSTQSLQATYEYCLAGGCTQFMITMATNSIQKFLTGIERVSEYWQEGGKGLLGLHLEGPYLNPKKKGAHVEKLIKRPTMEEVEMLMNKGKGVVKMMTIAPEQCDPEIIQFLLSKKVLVSAGHSNATYAEASNAFYAGVPAATHLFNAMSPLQGREPGMVGAIYDHPDVMASVVCDGIHVDYASIRISKKIMEERLFFITDAVVEIRHGEYQHIFSGDRFTLPDGTLSGSALSMIQAVRNGVEKVGIPLPEALRMASAYPAKLSGHNKKLGSIHPGARADFVVLDDSLNIHQVIVDGE